MNVAPLSSSNSSVLFLMECAHIATKILENRSEHVTTTQKATHKSTKHTTTQQNVGFRWVPLGSVFSLGSVVPLVPLLPWFPWVPLIFAVPLVSGVPLGSVVPLVSLVSVVLLGSLVPLGSFVFDGPVVPLGCVPTRHDGNTAQHNTTKQIKKRRSAAEAVACK